MTSKYLPVWRTAEAKSSIKIEGVVTNSLAAFSSLRGPRRLVEGPRSVAATKTKPLLQIRTKFT